MRTFDQKQQYPTAASSDPDRPTIATSPKDLQAGSIRTAASRFVHDFSQIPVPARASEALQAKLTIDQPGDKYEQEADQVAEQVMAAPEQLTINGTSPHIQRFAGQPAQHMEFVPSSVNQALASPGSPLEPALLQDMEQRFGHDFSHVRVHTGVAAERSAQDVSANAYTLGHNIVFGAGRFTPRTYEGCRLLAHELAHVIQQNTKWTPSKLKIEPASGAREQQAEAVAKVAAAGSVGTYRRMLGQSTGSVPRGIQRQHRAASTEADDWDFSVADYRVLQQGGGHLRFASDSGWLPIAVKTNILATLMYLYETAGQRAFHMTAGAHARQPSNIGVIPFTGVSGRDLYHAHVVVERFGMQGPSRAELQRRFTQALGRSDQVLHGRNVTTVNRSAYTAAVQAAERSATPLLDSIVRTDRYGDLVFSLPGAGIIYHTLEVLAGSMGMRAGDPRRNILTRFDDLTPRLYQPSDPGSANFRDEFDEVMELSFLVDASGQVHVHTRGLRAQSLTTGRSEGGVEQLLEYFAPPVEPQEPASEPQQTPPEFGIGWARPGITVYVNSATHPTNWSYTPSQGSTIPLQSWHEMGRPTNFVLIGNQRFFLHPDRRVSPI